MKLTKWFIAWGGNEPDRGEAKLVQGEGYHEKNEGADIMLSYHDVMWM